MKRLLAQANARSLARLATAHVLLAFDFDGTLAPIIPDRDRAVMRRQTARLFAQVCGLYPCAVISARRRGDVAARLGVARAKYVVGNSGIEPGENLGDFARIVADARPLLEQWLDSVDGVDIEDKQYSLALHYRRSRQKRTTRQAIIRAVARLPLRMKAVPGTLVVNVTPKHAPHKGDALLRLRAAERASAALYVGDAAADEDIFDLGEPGRLVTVRIGASRTSSAQYFLRDQGEIDALLARLVALRTPGPIRPAA